MTSAAAESGASLGRARAAVSAVFFVNAILYANLVPRLPDLKSRLDVTNAELGVALAGVPTGGFLAGLLAPAAIRRWGSARVAALGLVALASALVGVAFAERWLAFAAVLVVFGGIDGVVDVAQNAHGLRVQRRYGRSIVHSFHGMWSVGAVVGGVAGSVAAGASLDLRVHLPLVALVGVVVAVGARPHLLPGPEDAERAAEAAADRAAAALPAGGGTPAAPTAGAGPLGPVGSPRGGWRDRRPGQAPVLRAMAALGLLAVCAAFVEDAGASWGALYLRDDLGASAAMGGLAFVALQVAMTIGRFSGDTVVDRFGQRTVTRVGGGLIAGGMAVALAFPSVTTGLLGFACAGLGVATLVPAVMHAADELPGLHHGLGLTLVSWVLRAGFLLSPPVVGAVADASSLRVGLLGVVAAGAGILALGRALGPAGAHAPTGPPASR